MVKNEKVKKVGAFARRNAGYITAAVALTATAAGAQDAGAGFDIGAQNIATKAGATIIGIATAGAALKATGIGIKVAFKWAERLLKG